MVEIQSCGNLVNDSALCGIEEESKVEKVKVIAEISAELEREKQSNAELMERISFLESQIQSHTERDKASPHTYGHGCCSNATERSFKKFKQQKIERTSGETLNRNIIGSEVASVQKKHETQCLEEKLVNWMSMEETQVLLYEKLKDCDLTVNDDDADNTNDEEDDYRKELDIFFETKDRDLDVSLINTNIPKEYIDEGLNVQCLGISLGSPSEVKTTLNANQQEIDRCRLLSDTKPKADCNRGPRRSVLFLKKPPKFAFCPKEVKRIIQSEAILQKNAQSHTTRKILVFACLGIRHGCEDIYELDFNHFSILRKGEPYVSPQDPGEHVLYENPGIRRKVFYPNRQNSTLCPVRILEEEKTMRPADASCPSCLFLCIKYGGRTRNLPQNEYVRQRMGRNKLKSFGPLICRFSMLVNIRSGSFFFKTLGITLLFMAGFPDDIVLKETKYRNFDLLQKYYRTDADAEGEELFLPHTVTDNIANSGSKQLNGMTRAKSKGKKQTSNNDKSTVTPLNQFGLIGCPSAQTHALPPFHSMQSPSHILVDSQRKPFQSPYYVFPPQPTNMFLPIFYWPPPNSNSPGLYLYTNGTSPFPPGANPISFHSQPYHYYQPSCSFFVPKTLGETGNNEIGSGETDSNSDSSSSSRSAS